MAIDALEILKRVQEKPIHRTFAIDRAAVREESRTVSLAFASDKPVDHYFGRLILTMDKKAMRAERLKSGAPLLMDHNATDQVGVVESYSIGKDGVARAIVRFGESTRATEIFNDVKTGIRQNVSVGFMLHNLELEDDGKRTGGIPTYRSNDFEPYEISLVSVPADITVGVGRSMEKNMNNSENNVAEVSPDLAAASEIRGWGEAFGEQSLASRYIRQSVDSTGQFIGSKEGFFALVRANQPAATLPPSLHPIDAAYQQGGIQRGELARSVPRARLQNFKGERSQERAHAFGTWILGAVMGNAYAREQCQRNGWMVLNRAQNESVNEKGAYLVPDEFGNELVNLIEEHGVFRRNAKVVPMSSDTRSDPRVTGRLSATFVAESTSTTEQEMDFDRISLVARKTMVLVDFSSEVSEDSTISIGDTLAGEAARAFAELEDDCGFNGDATSTYGGIVGVREKLKGVSGTIANIKGLQVGTGNAYGELTLDDFAKTVARLPSYARKGAKWYMSLHLYWNVIVPLLLDAGGATIGEIEAGRGDRLFGIPIEYADKMPHTEANSQVCAIVGDLAMAASFGDRRMYRISISDQPRFKQDDWTLKATSRWDINVHDVGNTTEAGPIVGLITAAA